MQDLPALPVGISDIHQLLSGRYVYVDKTGFISAIIHYPRVYIASPHGFGKSTLVSTLAELFRNGPAAFEGKDIYETWPEDKCYYVITIKLHGLEAQPADRLEYRLCLRLVSAFINAGFKEAEAYLNCGDFDTLSVFLTNIVNTHHVVILIDDWDYPLRSMLCSNLDAHQTPLWGYCSSMLKVVFDWLHDLPNLHFCLVTGELYGLSAHLNLSNDFVDLTISSYLGFTEDDISNSFNSYINNIVDCKQSLGAFIGFKYIDNKYHSDYNFKRTLNEEYYGFSIKEYYGFNSEEYFGSSNEKYSRVFCPEDINYFMSDSENLTSFYESAPTQQLIRTYLKHPSSKLASAYIPKENNINIHETSTLLTPTAILTQLGLFSSNGKPSTKSIQRKLALLFANKRFDYNDSFKQALVCIRESFDNKDVDSTTSFVKLDSAITSLNEALTHVKPEIWSVDSIADVLFEILMYSGFDADFFDETQISKPLEDKKYEIYGKYVKYTLSFIDFNQYTITTIKEWRDFLIDERRHRELKNKSTREDLYLGLILAASQQKRKIMAVTVYHDCEGDSDWYDSELV